MHALGNLHAMCKHMADQFAICVYVADCLPHARIEQINLLHAGKWQLHIYGTTYIYTHYMITLIQCVMYLLAVDLTRQSGAKTSGSDINNIGQNNLKIIG